MSTKAERKIARLVSAYHEEQLKGLIAGVADAIERHRAGELDAFEVDEIIHHYHRATQKLWSFCNGSGADVMMAARFVKLWEKKGTTIDWWEEAGRRCR